MIEYLIIGILIFNWFLSIKYLFTLKNKKKNKNSTSTIHSDENKIVDAFLYIIKNDDLRNLELFLDAIGEKINDRKILEIESIVAYAVTYNSKKFVKKLLESTDYFSLCIIHKYFEDKQLNSECIDIIRERKIQEEFSMKIQQNNFSIL